MWFKNLQVYKLNETLEFTPETLEAALAEKVLQECGPREPRTLGWVSPLARQVDATDAPLVEQAAGVMVIAMGSEERLLPPSVVNEELMERAQQIEQSEGRKPSRKEKLALKEEIEFELLPKAFTRRRALRALIDVQDGWVMVDSAAENKAEELLSLLRETLGGLKVMPLCKHDGLLDVMTQWLKTSDLPAGLEIGFDVELRETGDDKGIIRCVNFDLQSEDVQNALKVGRVVSKMGFVWQERLSLMLNDRASILRLKYLDQVLEELENMEADSREMEFASMITLMLGEIRPLLRCIAAQVRTDG